MKIYVNKCDEIETVLGREKNGWTGTWLSGNLKDNTSLKEKLNTLIKSLEPKSDFDKVADKKIKDKVKIYLLTKEIAVSLDFSEKRPGWKIIQNTIHGKNEKTYGRILGIVKSLFKQGILDHVFGALYREGDKNKIYYPLVYLKRNVHEQVYTTFSANFNNIDCYDKLKGNDELLFIFKYVEPRLIRYKTLAITPSSFNKNLDEYREYGFFEVKINSKFIDTITTKLYIQLKINNNKKFYQIQFGSTGYVATLHADPLAMIFTTKTLDQALNKLKSTLNNRGFKILNFEELKKNIEENEQ